MNFLWTVCVLCFIKSLNGDITLYNTPKIGEYEVVGMKYGVILPGSSIFTGPAPTFVIDANIQQHLGGNGTHTEILLFHSFTHQYFGVKEGKGLCCKTEYYEQGLCNNPGGLAIDFTSIKLRPCEGKDFWRSNAFNVFYWPPQDTAIWKFHEKLRLSYDGLWYLIIANCYENKTSESVDATLIFSNPFGYLSITVFPHVPVHLSLATAYFGLLMVWTTLMVVYKKNLVQMQHVMLFAILIGFIHELIWSIEWYLFNSTGTPSHILALIGTLFTTIKLTVIRTLILLVSIGYSILFETLDVVPKVGVILLTSIYGTLLGTSEYLTALKDMGYPVTDSTLPGLFWVLTALNSIFSLWIFYSLRVNLSKLRDKKPMPNRQIKMYREMSYGLLVAGIACLLAFVIERVMSVMGMEDQLWSTWWLFFGFWEYFYFFLTSFVSFIWRPNPKNFKFDINYKSVEDDPQGEDSSSTCPPPPSSATVSKHPLQPASPMIHQQQQRKKDLPGGPKFKSLSKIEKIRADMEMQNQTEEISTEELEKLIYKDPSNNTNENNTAKSIYDHSTSNKENELQREVIGGDEDEDEDEDEEEEEEGNDGLNQ